MLFKAKAKYKNDTIIFEVYVPQGEKEECLKEALAKARETAKKVFNTCYDTEISIRGGGLE
jgi:hypothetical protein